MEYVSICLVVDVEQRRLQTKEQKKEQIYPDNKHSAHNPACSHVTIVTTFLAGHQITSINE